MRRPLCARQQSVGWRRRRGRWRRGRLLMSMTRDKSRFRPSLPCRRSIVRARRFGGAAHYCELTLDGSPIFGLSHAHDSLPRWFSQTARAQAGGFIMLLALRHDDGCSPAQSRRRLLIVATISPRDGQVIQSTAGYRSPQDYHGRPVAGRLGRAFAPHAMTARISPFQHWPRIVDFSCRYADTMPGTRRSY